AVRPLERIGEKGHGRGRLLGRRRGERSHHHLLTVRAADLLAEVFLADRQDLPTVPALEVDGLHAGSSRPVFCSSPLGVEGFLSPLSPASGERGGGGGGSPSHPLPPPPPPPHRAEGAAVARPGPPEGAARP